jgi:hypothetical protein
MVNLAAALSMPLPHDWSAEHTKEPPCTPDSKETWPQELCPVHRMSHAAAAQVTRFPQALTPAHSTLQDLPPHSMVPTQLCMPQKIEQEEAFLQLTPLLHALEPQLTRQGIFAGH